MKKILFAFTLLCCLSANVWCDFEKVNGQNLENAQRRLRELMVDNNVPAPTQAAFNRDQQLVSVGTIDTDDLGALRVHYRNDNPVRRDARRFYDNLEIERAGRTFTFRVHQNRSSSPS